MREVWCLVPIVLALKVVKGLSFWRLDSGEVQRRAEEMARMQHAEAVWKPSREWIHHDSFNVADAFRLDPDEVKLLKRKEDRLAE